MRSSFVCVSIVLTATLWAGADAVAQKKKEAEIKPGSLGAARAFLEGRWNLVSMDVFPPGKPVIHAGATGTMDYDDYAAMTVRLRVDKPTAELFEQIGIPSKNGVISQTGKTLVDMTGKKLTYILDGQALIRPPQHPLDTNMPRYWEVSGNTLTLRTKDQKTGAVLSETVWRKQP